MKIEITNVLEKYIDDFAACVFQTNYPLDRFPNVGKVDPIIIKALDNERLVGVIIANQIERTINLATIAVASDQQGKNIGRLLIEALETFAKNQGVISITLTTLSYQAKTFYEKMGYQIFGQIDHVPVENITKYFFVKYVN